MTIDAATAEVAEVAAAVDDVTSGCGSEASFGIAWFLIAMLVAVVTSALVFLCVWCTRLYFTGGGGGSFEEL